MPWDEYGNRKSLYKKSGFKMKGFSAFTKLEEQNLPEEEQQRTTDEVSEYNALNTKLQDNGFLEDADATRYHTLAKKLGKN